ncbi:hypothetical protein [Terribacillus saccharophilus]|uniref:hypothetical protein n=1 Tax=Terribacillus saccharophilus TaxID=361277 RepID=UPI001FE7B698|nr:hypothetical protein [Terribacillus saccharophilus]
MIENADHKITPAGIKNVHVNKRNGNKSILLKKKSGQNDAKPSKRIAIIMKLTKKASIFEQNTI